MLLDISRDVSTSNISNVTEFSISENSSKLFSMLSSFLYTDKHRAVLTELSSNALDAHSIVNKQDVPFELTMPTNLCPEIRIRDFGPGLSEENVIKFLTTYGESSKQSDANLIGGYGIGSKSPACLTDTWSIISYHNGIMKKYTIFVSSNGIPSLTKIFEKATEESGLEVIIPVKKGDDSKWKEAAEKVYAYYPIKPVIHNHKIYWFELPIFFESENGKVIDTRYRNSGLLVNNRFYQLDTSLFTDDPKVYSFLNNCRIHLKFNPSEISLSLSREDVQYDTKSINAIKNRLNNFVDDILNLWDKQSKDYVEDFEYFVGISNFVEKLSRNNYRYSDWLYRYIIQNTKNDITKYNLDQFDYAQQTISIEVPNDFTCKQRASGYKSNFASFREDRANNKRYMQLMAYSCLNIVFLVNDSSYVVKKCNEHYYGKNVMIAENFDFLPNFLKKQIVLASSLPKPIINRQVKSNVVKSDYYYIDGKRFYTADWDFFEKSAKENRLVYMYFTNSKTASSILPEFIKYFEQFKNFSNIQIIFLKDGTAIPQGAVHPKEYVQSIHDELEKDLESIYYTSTYLNVYIYMFQDYYKTQHQSKWNEFVDFVSKCKVCYDNSQQYLVQAKRVKYGITCNLLDIDDKYNYFKPASEIIDEILNQYPVLKLVNQLNLISEEKELILKEYINSVGK